MQTDSIQSVLQFCDETFLFLSINKEWTKAYLAACKKPKTKIGGCSPKQMKYALRHGLDSTLALDSVIISGNLPTLKYLIEKRKYEWTYKSAEMAARYGQLEVLKYAIANRCYRDSKVCENAAKYGYFEVLKWARAQHIPWGLTISNAAEGGHLDILIWAHENECPQDPWGLRDLITDNKVSDEVREWILERRLDEEGFDYNGNEGEDIIYVNGEDEFYDSEGEEKDDDGEDDDSEGEEEDDDSEREDEDEGEEEDDDGEGDGEVEDEGRSRRNKRMQRILDRRLDKW